MGLALLDRFPALIEASLKGAASEGYLGGQADAYRVVAAARERRQATAARPAPRKPQRLDLCLALADPIQRKLMKVALGMDGSLLDRVAIVGATLSDAKWAASGRRWHDPTA